MVAKIKQYNKIRKLIKNLSLKFEANIDDNIKQMIELLYNCT